MERFSPKLEIINHFDDLIQQIDIDIDESMSKYNENQIFREISCFQVENRTIKTKWIIEFFESYNDYKEETIDQWSESTKVVEYLKEIRMRTIEELRNEQKESVENSSRFNYLNSELTKEEKRSEIFAEKFYFQVRIKRPDYTSWVFDLFTFVTDFYMSQYEIDLLEKLINDREMKDIFDEKMVLICLVYKYFCINIENQKFPNHVIQVFKQDVSKIELLIINDNISAVKLNSSSTIDLSKLTHLNITNLSAYMDYFIIDNLASLKYLTLFVNSVKEISLKNLYSLKELNVISKEVTNIQIDHLPNIEKLFYMIKSMRIGFNKLEKLLCADNICFTKNINFVFFINNFCNQIEKLLITNFDFENIIRFFGDFHFPKLLYLNISCCNISRIEKKMFNSSMPLLRKLEIEYNNRLEIIDPDAFSNLKELVSLSIKRNNFIQPLDRKSFVGLENLNEFNFSN